MKMPAFSSKAAISTCLVSLLMMPMPAMAAVTPQYLPPIAPQLDQSAFAPVETPVAAPSRNARSNDSYENSAPASESSSRVKDLLRQALMKHSEGDSAGAQKLFKQVLSIDSRNADANFNLGAMAEDAGDLQAAQRYYRAAAAATGGADGEAQEALANVESRMRQQNQQKEAARQVAKNTQLRDMAQQATTAYKAGNFDKAIEILEQIDRQAPGDANVKYGLGQAYRGKGDMQRAQQNLAAAASIAPDSELYRNTLTEFSKQKQNVASQPQAPNNAYNDTNSGMPYGGRDYGQMPEVANDYRSPGELTPFSQNDDRLYGRAYDQVRQPMLGGLGSAMGLGGLAAGLGGLMGGRATNYGYSNVSRGNRLMRGAVTGGLTGAAAGAVAGMIGGGRGAVKSGAMRGAITGGLFGLLSSF